jgi:hypothetical protein
MATSYEYWDNVCNKVNTLRAEGYTLLQIEEETGHDYEDIQWAVHQYELLDAMRDTV